MTAADRIGQLSRDLSEQHAFCTAHTRRALQARADGLRLESELLLSLARGYLDRVLTLATELRAALSEGVPS